MRAKGKQREEMELWSDFRSQVRGHEKICPQCAAFFASNLRDGIHFWETKELEELGCPVAKALCQEYQDG